MKTFVTDIIPRIRKYSQQLDNLTLLTKQHWVLIDEIGRSKNVYIFRPNSELLIARDGVVEKSKWEYLGNNSILIDTHNNSYLFRHGFLDENILALKVDSKDEYAFFINETRFSQEINTIDRVSNFLMENYIHALPGQVTQIEANVSSEDMIYKIADGELVVRAETNGKERIFKVFLNGVPAPNNKYKLGFLEYIKVKNGIGEFSSSPFD